MSKAAPHQPEDFEWSLTEEPHASRRAAILKAHPEVTSLMGPEPATKYVVTLVVLLQVYASYLMSTQPWWVLLLVAYTFGGVCNHSMTLAMHEISHNLAFKSNLLNKLFGIFTNLPLGIPSFGSFRMYHPEHHKFQGEDIVDTDVPTEWEGHFFTSPFRKLIWVILQPLFYALRPNIIRPIKPNFWIILNWIVQIAFDYAIVHFFGGKALFYLIVGTLLGMGLHPMAGHFIAEHYTFIKGQETYSYYGPLNWFSFNVGYHNEHHDFPFVPGSRLPLLKKMAPEFYDNLPHHTSWIKVIYTYIMDPSIGPFSRVKRHTLKPEELKQFLKTTLIKN